MFQASNMSASVDLLLRGDGTLPPRGEDFYRPQPDFLQNGTMRSNLVLIGMPGAGKSTIGVLLARHLGYAFLDTDLLIQSKQGNRPLQEIVDELGQDRFRAYEEQTCSELDCHHTVIATGGSVVYFPKAMEHFATLGTLYWLDVPYPDIERRVAAFPDRGLAIRPGQTLADLHAERTPLYEKFAQVRIDCTNKQPAEIVHEILSVEQ